MLIAVALFRRTESNNCLAVFWNTISSSSGSFAKSNSAGSLVLISVKSFKHLAQSSLNSWMLLRSVSKTELSRRFAANSVALSSICLSFVTSEVVHSVAVACVFRGAIIFFKLFNVVLFSGFGDFVSASSIVLEIASKTARQLVRWPFVVAKSPLISARGCLSATSNSSAAPLNFFDQPCSRVLSLSLFDESPAYSIYLFRTALVLPKVLVSCTCHFCAISAAVASVKIKRSLRRNFSFKINTVLYLK